MLFFFFFFSSRRRHTRCGRDWSSDVCSSDLGCLYAAIHTNLLFDVDMQVEGAKSYNGLLRWYIDRTTAILPEAGVISLPIWVWRGLMLLWALWLSWRLIHWLPWAWRCFSEQTTWKKMSLATNTGNHPNPLQRTIVRPNPAGPQPNQPPAPEPNNKPEPPPEES